MLDILNLMRGMRGEIEITERRLVKDKETGLLVPGDIVGHFKDHNVILNQGKRMMIEAFSTPVNGGNVISTIKVGKDVGNGDILNPQEPTASLTEAALDEVYETPTEEFFVTYPTNNSVRFLATINGSRVMDQYPGQANVIYTSAMIAGGNGRGFAYRRFPARTISALISVEISWTISFDDCNNV